MKEFSRIVFVGSIVALILWGIDLILSYTSGEVILFDGKMLKNYGVYCLYSIPISLVNSYFFDYINTRVSWTETTKKYRLLIGIVGSVFITIFTVFLVRMVHQMLIEGQSYAEFINSQGLTFYFIALLITIVFSVFFHAIYFYKELQRNKVTEQKIIAGTASAQFDALKNQLDPHFLFNSLNVLSSLIDENPRQAQKFTSGLSKVYRYVLEQKNKELVTVDEEFKFAKTYMSILKMRFEDSIIFEIPEAASNPESKVVPLSLQLLLENAVKHNMVTPSKPLRIKIYEEGGNLIVQNNLQEKQIVKKSSGVGLNNITQRYDLLTEREVHINKTASDFQVALPMLTKQVEIMRNKAIGSGENPLDDEYIKARKHVENLKEFYYNVLSYCLVIPFLVFINLRTSPEFHWFWFPMFGWGIGLAFHAMSVYIEDGRFGKNWEERKIREYMEQEERKRWN
ncbi:2TM domain-containing protein [Kordia sp. YSTF-M3]|uniref:2TM domain-containing protein n=1 Tax=Kordia aestuariivivens TaxID=2759037 RepID=A0ABR7Q5Y6_9FLAO|nr:2TM domain-containing protein [Kordia aestuariivivens]MBC8753848.1 2TM domain-containing protein [Kordia aestuariivivens]